MDTFTYPSQLLPKKKKKKKHRDEVQVVAAALWGPERCGDRFSIQSTILPSSQNSSLGQKNQLRGGEEEEHQNELVLRA